MIQQGNGQMTVPSKALSLWSAVTISICALILSVELLFPLSWDNWVYQTMGWDLIRFGKWPYLGSWDVNFPGIVFIHAISIALFGTSDLSFRIFDVLFQIATCYLLIRYIRLHASTATSLLAPIVHCLIYTSMTWSVAGQRDAFVPGFLFAGILLVRRALGSDDPSRRLFRNTLLTLGGAFVSFCSIIRPTYLLFALGLVAVFTQNKALRYHLLPLASGCIAGIFLPLLPYIFHDKGIYTFYTFAIRFNLDVYAQLSRNPLELWDSERTTLVTVSLYLILGLVSWVIFYRNGKGQRSLVDIVERRLYPLLVAASIISILVMRKYLANHLLPLMALLSPIIAVAIAPNPKPSIKPWVRIMLTIAFLGFLGYRLYPRNVLRHYFDGLQSPLGGLIYAYDQQDGDERCGYLAEQQAVQYMNRINPGKEPVEVLCYNRPYLRVPCRLKSITRFTEVLPLGMVPPSGHFTSYQLDWQREFLDTLQAHRPAIIVEADNRFRIYMTGSPLEAVQRIPGFGEFFHQNYKRDTAIHGFTFYRLYQ